MQRNSDLKWIIITVLAMTIFEMDFIAWRILFIHTDSTVDSSSIGTSEIIMCSVKEERYLKNDDNVLFCQWTTMKNFVDQYVLHNLE